MNPSKRIIIPIILFMLILFQTCSYAASFNDISGISSEKAIKTLAILDIVRGDEHGNFRPDSVVTRTEFAAMIVRICGHEKIAAGMKNENNYTDVPPEHWASGYVNLTLMLGVMKGISDKEFEPDKPITYEQAVTVVVRTLGYYLKTGKTEDYPDGYLKVAAEKVQILDNVNGTMGSPITRSTAAQLLYNSLTAKVNLLWIGSVPEDYSEVPDTILWKDLDVKRQKGTVKPAVTDGVRQEDEVVINGERYKAGETNATELLECEVTFYAVEDKATGTKTIIFIKKE